MAERYINIMVIEDERFDVMRIENTLKLSEHKINIQNVVASGNDAINLISKNQGKYDVIIMDYQIAGALIGEELIKKIKSIDSTLQIIVITKLTLNITDYQFATNLIGAGAFWFCTKYPVDIEEFIYQPTDFLLNLFNAYEKKIMEKQRLCSNQKLQKSVDDILEKKKLFSVSEHMEKLNEKIKKYAQSDTCVLISGDSGTGKELVAYNLHYNSSRKFENFVPINCGSIPNDLIESELFGYNKGAFTGANQNKLGLFEIADKGTIFLDEVAELPLSSQVKLLRFLQEGEIEKIGRTKSKRVDVRVIAATNKNLQAEVSEGRFREDLFYRLNVVPINIKPLRERPKDIDFLFKYFIKMYSYEMGRIAPTIEPEALNKIVDFNWPGNVRQLKNVAQRLMFASESAITVEDVVEALPAKISDKKKSNTIFNFEVLNDITPLKNFEKEFRKEYFSFVRSNSISDAEAAQKLGLAPPNYFRMCKELGMK